MFELLIVTLGVCLGVLLATGLAMYIMLQPGVMKLYMKHAMKCMTVMEDITEELYNNQKEV